MVMVVVSLDAWSRLAETTAVPPFSEIELSSSVSVTVGGPSLSCTVREAPVTVRVSVFPAATLLAAVPTTLAVRSKSYCVLSTAVICTVSAEFEVAFAGMVMVASEPTVYKFATGVMVMTVSALDARSKLAETVVAAFSASVLRVSASVAVGVSSSSVMVAVPIAVPRVALVGLLNATFTVSSGSSKVSCLPCTPIVLLVSPGAKVLVPRIKPTSSELAVPPTASPKNTVTLLPLAALSETVKNI